MDAFLAGLKTVIDSLGSTVVLPIFIFLLAWAMGAKPARAFRAGVTIGIAFIGINLVINLMWGSLSGVAQAMVTNTGIKLDTVDVGWPSAAAIAFGSSVGLWVIPIALLVNIVLLFTNVTKTLNVDIWNFWHFAFIGSLIVAATGQLWYGLVAAAIAAAFALFLADWTAKAVQHFYGLPGISIPHLTSAPVVPIAIGVNWLIEKIPGLRDLNADTETIQKKFGILGEPIIQGLVIGLILGIIGYYNAGDAATVISKVLQCGMNLAAVMLLLPRMVKILMEGLIPVSEAARTFMQKHYGGREFYIGLDSAILIGHPAAISSSLVLVPLVILLSFILPGNHVLLFADLAIIPFVVAMCAPLMKGNVVRIIIAGLITLGVGFYFGTGMADLFTSAAQAAKFQMPENAVKIISIGDGFLWPPFVFTNLVKGLGVVGLVILIAAIAALFFFFSKNTKSWEKAAGAPVEE
ncbi:PTS galactitol transporter subunit IIC [Leptolinea tardivitalis]|uniref:DNA mismatch repair protein MutT n=1 Tax=Leptolinea tardivitalis TaxID=229920 RepID=A0A0P6X033_9CHLR|nr:PTS transporter subunit IIC [Leptolinea tardivitalis]KPL72525.1 DNA mismatch repair protein MutT [Leptolinea tardivitalis]GAP21181.1 PTS system IIC component, Gat family [Leptolinea tardivitalis]